MADLEDAIRARRSIRRFLPRPVARELIEDALRLAQRAPSNSNIQPWRLFLAFGAARDRLRDAFLGEVRRGPPHIPRLPPAFEHHRRDLGAQVYGAMNIAREDKAARADAVRRNFDFFGAPVAGIVCMHGALGEVDAIGVGMFLEAFVLVLTAHGVGTCLQVALAGYPDVARQILGIPAELTILCGISIGYPDPDFPANRLQIPRASLDEHVVIVET